MQQPFDASAFSYTAGPAPQSDLFLETHALYQAANLVSGREYTIVECAVKLSYIILGDYLYLMIICVALFGRATDLQGQRIRPARFSPPRTANRSPAIMAHMRQSSPCSGVGFQVKVLDPCEFLPLRPAAVGCRTVDFEGFVAAT